MVDCPLTVRCLFFLSVYISVCLSVYLYVCVSVCLSVSVSLCLSMYLPVCQCISMSVYVCLSVSVSLCLSSPSLFFFLFFILFLDRVRSVLAFGTMAVIAAVFILISPFLFAVFTCGDVTLKVMTRLFLATVVFMGKSKINTFLSARRVWLATKNQTGPFRVQTIC